MALVGLEGPFTRSEEVKYSTDLNFKHSVSTQLNFQFSGLIESNGLENRTSSSAEIFLKKSYSTDNFIFTLSPETET